MLPVEESVVAELVSLRTSDEAVFTVFNTCVATELVDEFVRVVEVVDVSPAIPNTFCSETELPPPVRVIELLTPLPATEVETLKELSAVLVTT